MATYLELGLVNADSSLMRLLPPQIAYRYHALPVGTDGKHIAVAMAEPDDPQASQAIQEVIGRPLCLIHADRALIDRQLHHLWPGSAPQTRLLTWFPERSAALELFSGYLSEQLGAVHEAINMPADSPDPINTLKAAISDHRPDLLVFQARHPSRVMRQILKPGTHNKITRLSSFLALPARPIWPLKNILLILPDSKIKLDLAVSWTEKIAQPTKSKVTVLPVLPNIPLMYGSFLYHSIDAILAGNDQLGGKLRQIAVRFTGMGIQGVYKLRYGDPEMQIKDEIVSSQADMIIMPSCLRPGCNSWLNADLPGNLIKSLTIPMLLTSGN